MARRRARHCGRGKQKHLLAEGPVLELAPGVGNNGLHLALNAKVPYYYAGLSLLETSFAQQLGAERRKASGPESFRVLPPYSAEGGWKLGPPAASRSGHTAPRQDRDGARLPDVLEHVPNWEATVKALVRCCGRAGC